MVLHYQNWTDSKLPILVVNKQKTETFWQRPINIFIFFLLYYSENDVVVLKYSVWTLFSHFNSQRCFWGKRRLWRPLLKILTTNMRANEHTVAPTIK